MLTRDERDNFPFELVRPQLASVEASIRDVARAFDPALEGYVSYVTGTSGKRIRPALSILAAGATGGVTGAHVRLGVVLEMIHIATLVHDDIMDGAEIRRKVPTANARWGASLSVLLGDCLFAHALDLSTHFDDNCITRKIARAACDVCTGEIIQTQRRFDLNLSRETYFKIIRLKTAALFSAATGLAAALSGAPEEVQERLASYGEKLGAAYQIYDDCLDLVGEEETVGKTLGTDLAKGKLTLPILNLIESASDTQRAKLNRLLIQHEPLEIGVLAGIADYQGAIEGAVGTARNLLADARKDLLVLPASDSAQALEQVTFYLEARLGKCVK
ncbi:MAG: polyprenyl synthetase family protein [Verrucomicrobiales bacterium]